MDRIEKLEKILQEQGLDGLLLFKVANIRYLTGFTGADSYAVVSSSGRAFITDSRYIEQAAKECPDFEVSLFVLYNFMSIIRIKQTNWGLFWKHMWLS